MNTCLFCKIVAGEISADKVYEDDTVFAFLDIHPVNIGHTLVVPKAHATNLYDIPETTLAHMATVMQKLSIAVKKAVGADGINIEMNNDPVAGQIIMHTHLHIVPRFQGDGFTHWHSPRDYRESEAVKVAHNIKTHL